MQILCYKSIDSTQNQARELINQGFSDFCVIADEQSLGRGTQGRKWVSEKGSGLYLSVVLPLKTNLYSSYEDLTDFCSLITSRAVEILKDTIKKYCKNSSLEKLYIKPINDLYYDLKKLAGILVEHIVHDEKSFLIIGIGLNLKKLSEEQSFPVISLEEILGSGFDFDREVFSDLLSRDLLDLTLSPK